MGVVIEVSEAYETTQFLPVDSSEGVFSEAWLQETLRRNPNVLPVEEFGPVFHPLVPIGKEVPTRCGQHRQLVHQPRRLPRACRNKTVAES
jgi:hypothetical protein